MQNSELYRRGVVLPATEEAEEKLRINDVDQQTPVEYLQIKDELLFELLWELQLFETINARTGSLIDDYEEEFIEPEDVGRIREAVDEILLKEGAQCSEIRSFLRELSRLAAKAERSQRALLFVL